MEGGRHPCVDSVFGLNDPGDAVRFTVHVSRSIVTPDVTVMV
jgi:hypothetical protein